jgi:hypothetical protein
MVVHKYVSPKKMILLVQKWPHKNEFIDLSNIKVSKTTILRVSYFKSIPTNITQLLSILCLHSNLEGILTFNFLLKN